MGMFLNLSKNMFADEGNFEEVFSLIVEIKLFAEENGLFFEYYKMSDEFAEKFADFIDFIGTCLSSIKDGLDEQFYNFVVDAEALRIILERKLEGTGLARFLLLKELLYVFIRNGDEDRFRALLHFVFHVDNNKRYEILKKRFGERWGDCV